MDIIINKNIMNYFWKRQVLLLSFNRIKCEHKFHWFNLIYSTYVQVDSIAQVNININLVISRRLNANASTDVPKPLYQWGGCASPLIQSFGCTDSARALRRTSCTQGSKLFKFVAFSSVSSHFIFFWGGDKFLQWKK